MTTTGDLGAHDERLRKTTEDLDALANEHRLRLLHLLTSPRYAEEIAEALGMSRQSALKHIDKLQQQGFIRAMHGRRATGPVIEYVVVPQRLFALGITIGEMGKLEPEGGPQLKPSENTVMIGPEAQTPPAPTDPSRAHLLILSGPGTGTRFPLEGDGPRWTLGRDDDRSLTLRHDPYVSGRHAEIQREMTAYALVDVFSANGTFLNFARLPRGGRVPLRPGDVVGLGHTLLVYQTETV